MIDNPNIEEITHVVDDINYFCDQHQENVIVLVKKIHHVAQNIESSKVFKYQAFFLNF